MIYKFISIKNIAEKIYRDYEFNESLDIDDVVEWGGEALRKINVTQQYQYYIAKLCIENYKDILPCNFYSLEQIYYNGRPMKPAVGTFIENTSGGTFSTTTYNTLPVSTGISGADLILSDLDDLGYEYSAELQALIEGTFTSLRTEDGRSHTYEIANNYIYTSFSDGYIWMIYRGIPVDLDGYPLIPDNVYYEEAVACYIQYRIDYRDWRSARISEKVYGESKANWNKYVVAARASGMTPTVDQLDALRRMWTRLIPNITANSTFYTNLDKQEILVR